MTAYESAFHAALRVLLADCQAGISHKSAEVVKAIGIVHYHLEAGEGLRLDAAAAPVAALAPQSATTEWISVDERLPGEKEDVLIAFWPYNNHQNKQSVTAAEHINGVFYLDDDCACHPPSHWMVMPAIPAAPALPATPAKEGADL